MISSVCFPDGLRTADSHVVVLGGRLTSRLHAFNETEVSDLFWVAETFAPLRVTESRKHPSCVLVAMSRIHATWAYPLYRPHTAYLYRNPRVCRTRVVHVYWYPAPDYFRLPFTFSNHPRNQENGKWSIGACPCTNAGAIFTKGLPILEKRDFFHLKEPVLNPKTFLFHTNSPNRRSFRISPVYSRGNVKSVFPLGLFLIPYR